MEVGGVCVSWWSCDISGELQEFCDPHADVGFWSGSELAPGSDQVGSVPQSH